MLIHLAVCAALLGADGPNKAELEKLQGTWVMQQEDGTPKELRLVVAKDRIRLIFVCCGNGEKKGKLKIDASATPRLIDLVQSPRLGPSSTAHEFAMAA